ncbi:MAG: hypothetical protein NC244_10880 [Alistipes senegalensis]|nr:hypothetical protein [Alistipes senegalensis]
MNLGSSTMPSSKQIYRVRKSWSDVKSQIGAFSFLENAKKVCKTGYTVFDEKGNAVFPVPRSYTKGTKIELRDSVLYVSATATSGTKRSGTYYIYDGNAVNDRYRITTKPEYYGNTPAGKYVTGCVNKADI